MKINLIKVNNILGINFYTGSIRLGDLFDNFQIPVYRAGSSSITAVDSGYQREAKSNRVEAVSSRITTVHPGMQLPNTEPFVDNVNLNLRSIEAEKSYVKAVGNSKDEFGSFYEFEYIPNLGKFQFVDGQTRIKGAQRAYTNAKNDGKDQLAKDIAENRVHVTLSFCEDVFKEAYVFYLINHYSKAIPPDGATRLLHEGQKNSDVNFSNEVTRSNKSQEIESMVVAEKLNHHSKVWAGSIKDFNESGGGKMSIRAVAKIIMPFYKNVKERNLGNRPHEDVVYETVESFWRGIKMAYPDMFKAQTSHQYNILKAGPSEVMMLVLDKIFELSSAGHKTGKLSDPKTFEVLMKNVLDAHQEDNSSGIKVSGAKLFLIGKEGAMGQYSNSAAKKDAARRINRTLFNELGIQTP
jgi:hypothetical protein